MSKINYLFVCLFILISCGESDKHADSFPVEKRFWTPEDYDKVNLELNFGFEADEKLPRLDDPTYGVVVKKLVDHQNFNVVLEDEELGIVYKRDMSEKFFEEWKDMLSIYDRTNNKDEYTYDIEMLEVYHFGLDLQLLYFSLGNQVIVQNASDPDAFQIQGLISSNSNTVISNFSNYLNFFNQEDSFTEEGKELLAKGLDVYFPQLIALFPKGDFSMLKSKVESLKEKVSSTTLKNSLENLQPKFSEE